MGLGDIISQIYHSNIFLIIVDYLNKKKILLNDIYNLLSKDTNDECGFYNKIFIIIVIIIFFFSFFYIIYNTYAYNYFFANSLVKRLFSNQLKLRDIPEFYQIQNIIYINDYFSLDLSLIFFVIAALIIYKSANYLDSQIILKDLVEKFTVNFNLFIIFSIIIIITGVIYYIINYNNLINVSKRNNLLIKFIHENINKDYINSQKICNYTNKKDILDANFKLNKCNDLELNFNPDTLYKYVKNIMNEIYNNDNQITLEKFKMLKDKNGVFYKDKIVSAFYTYSLMYYYVSNNLYDDARELFSKFNHSINPILDLNYESVLLNKPDIFNYNTNTLIQVAFNYNKDIYYFIYNEYYNISSKIQNLIVDIYNLCKYRMISVYLYYCVILIIMLLIIIYYFTKEYFLLSKLKRNVLSTINTKQ
jgi:hypothetical protein